jgi:membrane protease YdiL (CAAX protease family)
MEKHPRFPTLAQAIFVLFILYGVLIVVSAAFADVNGRFKAGDAIASIVILTTSLGIAVAALATYKGLTYSALVHFGPWSVRNVMMLVSVPVFLLFAALPVLMIDLMALVVSVLPMTRSQYQMFQDGMQPGFATVFAMCVVAPFMEEMLFRGVFLRSFLNQYTVAQSIVFCALIFGAYHMNIYQCVAATVLGLLIGWLYVRTGSLWPCILAHAVYNGACYVLANVSSGENEAIGASGLPGWELQAFALLMVIAGGLMLTKLLGWSLRPAIAPVADQE